MPFNASSLLLLDFKNKTVYEPGSLSAAHLTLKAHFTNPYSFPRCIDWPICQSARSNLPRHQ